MRERHARAKRERRGGAKIRCASCICTCSKLARTPLPSSTLACPRPRQSICGQPRCCCCAASRCWRRPALQRESHCGTECGCNLTSTAHVHARHHGLGVGVRGTMASVSGVASDFTATPPAESSTAVLSGPGGPPTFGQRNNVVIVHDSKKQGFPPSGRGEETEDWVK